MRLFATSFRALACVAGVPSSCDERCVGLSVECRESCRGLFGMCASSCATKGALSASCPPIFPAARMAARASSSSAEGNGRDHGVGLRCGVAGAEPAHGVGFAASEATAFSSRLRRRGRRRPKSPASQRRAAYSRSASFSAASSSGVCFWRRAEDYSQTCSPDVLRHAGFAGRPAAATARCFLRPRAVRAGR